MCALQKNFFALSRRKPPKSILSDRSVGNSVWREGMQRCQFHDSLSTSFHIIIVIGWIEKNFSGGVRSCSRRNGRRKILTRKFSRHAPKENYLIFVQKIDLEKKIDEKCANRFPWITYKIFKGVKDAWHESLAARLFSRRGMWNCSVLIKKLTRSILA